ncbi:Hsp70 family protein [Dactylosporangium siamense]|uniref:Hsp70 family protein n=1 Tax=Dactylosporangium siamense TaxID=685454 RepID=UPI003607B7C9
MRADRVRLGIDFGTSSTVAVIGQPDGQVRPLLFGETPILPSAVCVDWRAAEAAFLVGRDAIHAGRAHPDAFEPNPKLRVDDGSVLLGPAELPVTTLIGAVLRRVGTEAERVTGAPVGEVTLTHPASWGPRRRAVLQEAARGAGMAEPVMVAEPVAAAAYFVEALGHAVPVGQCVVVYDFGAGTFDASVVGRTDDGFTVLAEEGLRDAGGLDIDNSVVAYFGATYGVANGDLWRRLTHPETPADRRSSRHFWDDVRTGKEMLSRSSSTSIFLPLVEADALLGREQLEHLARPLLDRTVTATATAIRAAQVDASRIAGVFLVGGSSRIPLAATLLHRTLGIAPTIIEQPELVVAGGSLIASAAATASPGTAFPPAFGSASVPAPAQVSPAAQAPATAPVSPAVSPVAPPLVSPVAPPLVSPVAPPLVSPVAPPVVSTPAAQMSPAAPGAAETQDASASAAAPVYTLPSTDVPSTFEQQVPPPWEQTPVEPFAAGPASAAPVSPGAAPVSPPAAQFSAAPTSPVNAAPMAQPVSAAPMSQPVSAAPVSPPVSAAPVSPPVSAAPVSPGVSAAPVSPSAGQYPLQPVSAAPGAAWSPTSPPVAAPDASWPPATPFAAAPPVSPAAPHSAWPPASPLGTGPASPLGAAPAPLGSAAVVRGLGIAVVVTALLRFALMFGDNGPASLILHEGYEPVFDYTALALLVALGGWLIARPGAGRPAMGLVAGLAPWALLPIVGSLGLISRFYDWVDEYPLFPPLLVLQLLTLLTVAGLVCRAALRAGTSRRLLPIGLGGVAFGTAVAALLWLCSGYVRMLASAELARFGLAIGVGTAVVYAAAGSRAWAGWVIGAWTGGGLLWLVGAGFGQSSPGTDALTLTLVLVLLAVAAVLLVVRLRTDRDPGAPQRGPAKGPATVALVAAGIAAIGVALVAFEQLERWSYIAGPYDVAEMFGEFAGLAVLLCGLLLLCARRSTGAAAYFVGAVAGPVSLLASPYLLDMMGWQLTAGLVLGGLAALILVVVLVRAAPTRLSWPLTGGALASLLLLWWAGTAVPFLHVDDTDRWLVLALAVAIPAAAIWKGGMVTAGTLFGVACSSVGAQFIAVDERVDEGPGLLLAVAVLATLATGFAAARTAQHQE